MPARQRTSQSGREPAFSRNETAHVLPAVNTHRSMLLNAQKDSTFAE